MTRELNLDLVKRVTEVANRYTDLHQRAAYLSGLIEMSALLAEGNVYTAVECRDASFHVGLEVNVFHLPSSTSVEVYYDDKDGIQNKGE